MALTPTKKAIKLGHFKKLIMKRKDFLKIATATTSLLVSENIFGSSLLLDAAPPVSKNFGIQLWSVRDDMKKDAKGTLQQLAKFGYKQIETFGGEMGMFWGMTPIEYKTLLTSLGMKSISAHYMEKDLAKFEAGVVDAAKAGLKILYCPWEGPNLTIDDYKKLADDLNTKGNICKKHGLKYGFHNHDFTFKELEGKMPQQVLMDNTDKKTVVYEMDIYWVVTAGQNPIEWLKKYPKRFVSSHVKDRAKGAAANNNDASCVLGTGQINFSEILKVAKKHGMNYFNVEQEKWENSTPIADAKLDADFMKTLKI
jgi:sugar phosphate isomerase/epimerase